MIILMCCTPTNVMILHNLVPSFVPLNHSYGKLPIFPRAQGKNRLQSHALILQGTPYSSSKFLAVERWEIHFLCALIVITQ